MTPLDAVLDRPSPADASPRSHQTVHLRALVADDERDVIEALRLLLTPHDLQVTGALTPAEALAATSAQSFDVAIVDLNFGKARTSGEQGLELVSTLRKLHPTLPVIAMTAWGSSDLAATAMRRGARDFVEKPWEEFRMLASVRAHAELGRAWRNIHDLQSELRQAQHGAPGAGGLNEMRLLEVEGVLVKQAMVKHDGNVSRAARALGLSRSALYRRLERHHVE